MASRVKLPGTVLAAACLMQAGWMMVAASSIGVTESRGFTAAFLQAVPGLLASTPRLRDSTAAGWLLVAGLIALSTGYVLTLRAWLRSRSGYSNRWVIGLTLIFIVTLFVTPGLLSSDVVTYAAYGRMGGLYGLNPYLNPPTAMPLADPTVQWMDVAVEHGTPYGPLWTAMSVALARITASLDALDWILTYRLLGALAHLANCYLIWRLVGLNGDRGDARWRGISLVAYAWNPLVLLEVVGSGHNDGVMLTPVLAGLLVIARRPGWRTALIAIWAGALVKWVPALMFAYVATVWMRRMDRWRTRTLNAAQALVALSAATLLLFWPWLDVRAPQRLLSSVSAGGERHVNALVDLPTPWLATHWLDRQGHDIPGAEATLHTWTASVVRVLFAGYVLGELRRLWLSRADLRAAIESGTRTLLIALLVVFTQVLDWYFVWPVTLGAAVGYGNAVARLAVSYSVLYLPVFYAIHEDLVPYTVATVLLVGYAVLPLLVATPVWRVLTRLRASHATGELAG